MYSDSSSNALTHEIFVLVTIRFRWQRSTRLGFYRFSFFGTKPKVRRSFAMSYRPLSSLLNSSFSFSSLHKHHTSNLSCSKFKMAEAYEKVLALMPNLTDAVNRSLYDAERVFAAVQYANLVLEAMSWVEPEGFMATSFRFYRKACWEFLNLDREAALAKEIGQDDVVKKAEETKSAWVAVIYDFERYHYEENIRHNNDSSSDEEIALGRLVMRRTLRNRVEQQDGSILDPRETDTPWLSDED